MLYIVFHPGNLIFQSLDIILSLLGIELQDTLHLDFQQLLDIIIRHGTNQMRYKRLQTLAYMHDNFLYRSALLEFLVFIYSLLDKNLLQGRILPIGFQLPQLDLQLQQQQGNRIVHRFP